MRLWSIHPRYLDAKGLVAVWREGLLAKKVLEGKTKGYKNHPQLIRFRATKDPLQAICAYLYFIWLEAERRGYRFDISKISPVEAWGLLSVTTGQLEFEFSHLLGKLFSRDKQQWALLRNVQSIQPHPIFKVIPGPVEQWEKVGERNGYKSFV